MQIAQYGLGIIGKVWARHWLADGHTVKAWNRTPQPAHPAYTADARGAAAGADLVVIVVADGPAVMGVLDTILPVLKPGALVANHATIGVDEVAVVAQRVRAAGGDFIDMPFTGSKTACEQRQVVWYVGDDANLLPRVDAVYRPLARALLPIGKVGSAMALKLAMNLMIANTYQALAEGFRLAGAAGISPDTFFSTLDLNVAKSGLVDLKKAKLIARDWSPQFSVKHMHKDLRLALALAQQHALTLPQTTKLEQSYERARAAGHADDDFSALYTTLLP